MKCNKPGTKNEIVLDHCRTEKRCAEGVQCCDIGAGMRGCAPKGTTEAQCRPLFKGNWHPIETTCECKDGWTGKLCDKKPCTNTCVADHTEKQNPSPDCACVCKDGYAGDSCETRINKICPNACDHGKQKPSPDCTCVCHDGWTGKACNKKKPCAKIGEDCTAADPCCTDLWCSDGKCEQKQKPCSNTCDADHTEKQNPSPDCTCVCEDGWTGDSCDEENINPDCNEEGTQKVLDNGTCQCYPRWSGDKCETEHLCNVLGRVHVAGDIGENKTHSGAKKLKPDDPHAACDCWPDWEGDLCQCYKPHTEDSNQPDKSCVCKSSYQPDYGDQPTGTKNIGYDMCFDYVPDVMWCGKYYNRWNTRDGTTYAVGCDEDPEEVKCMATTDSNHLGASCPDGYVPVGVWTDSEYRDLCSPFHGMQKCSRDPNWEASPDYMYCGEGRCTRFEPPAIGSAPCTWDSSNIEVCPNGFKEAGDPYNPTGCTYGHNVQKCCNLGGRCWDNEGNPQKVSKGECTSKKWRWYSNDGNNTCEGDANYKYCGKNGCFNSETEAECTFSEGDIKPCPDGYTAVKDEDGDPFKYSPRGCAWSWNIHMCKKDDAPDPTFMFCGQNGCYKNEDLAECSYWESRIKPCPTGYKQDGDKYDGPGCAWSFNIHRCKKSS